MVTYIYTGRSPLGFSYDGQQYLLTEGDTVALDGTNAFIDGLIAQGLLVVTRDRAENFVAEGRTLNYVVPGGQSVAAGAMVAVGNIVGVAQTEGAAGETVVLSLDGVWEFACASGAGIAAGDLVYRDSATNVDKDATNPFVGVAIAAQAGEVVKVRVISTGDGAGSGGGPLTWVGYVSQSGINDPIPEIIKADFTVVFQRVDTGDYLCTLPGGTDLDKVFFQAHSPAKVFGNEYEMFFTLIISEGLSLKTIASGSEVLSDDFLDSLIKIEIYP